MSINTTMVNKKEGFNYKIKIFLATIALAVFVAPFTSFAIAPTLNLYININHVNYSGAPIQLQYSGQNINSCTPSGDFPQWNNTPITVLNPSNTGGSVFGYGDISVTNTGTFTLSCTGADGTTISKSVDVTLNIEAPTLSLSPNPTSYLSGSGLSSTLTFNGLRLASCSTSGGINPWTSQVITPTNPLQGGSINGTFVTSPTSTTVYTLNCIGTSGEPISKSATVAVVVPSVTLTLNNQSSIEVVGGAPSNPTNVSLHWQGENLNTSTTTPCTASGGISSPTTEGINMWAGDNWAGSQRPSVGSRNIIAHHSTVYTISCLTPSGGTVTSSATLNVLPVPYISLSADHLNAQVQTSGNQLTWSGSNIGNNCTASEGKPGDGWAGPKSSSGSFPLGNQTTPGTFVYKISCPTIYPNTSPVVDTATVIVSDIPDGNQLCDNINPNTLGVCTYDATNVTSTKAVFNGKAKPIAGSDYYTYFRYITTSFPGEKLPLFCNDMYGSRMKSTKQKKAYNGNFNTELDPNTLLPDTQYAYCAVISNAATNPTQIRYGWVKTFRTKPCASCPQAGIETREANGITETSAILNANYHSVPPSDTWFKYSVYPAQNTGICLGDINLGTPQSCTSGSWITVGGEGTGEHQGQTLVHHDEGTYGPVSYTIEDLNPNTTYIYRAFIRTHNSVTQQNSFYTTGQPLPSQQFYGQEKTFTTSTLLNFTNVPQCTDGIDNDGDGFTDYPLDLSCASANDQSEFSPWTFIAECSDGTDNDGNGFTDYPDDINCSNEEDNTESPPPIPPSDPVGTLCPDGSPTWPICPGIPTPCPPGTSGPNCTITPPACPVGWTVGNSVCIAPPISRTPTVTVTASSTLISSGETSTISWTSANATVCDTNGLGGTGTSGSFDTDALTNSHSYSISCTGFGQTNSDSVTVLVVGSTILLPTVNVIANPASIPSGGASTISWTSTNATSCDAGVGNPSGQTSSGPSGSFTIGPLTSNYSYSITCTGPGGDESDNVIVLVGSQTTPIPTVTVTASPASISPGGSSTISWTSTNATSCDAGTGNSSGQTSSGPSGSFSTGPLTNNHSYSVSCTGPGGNESDNAIVLVGGSTLPLPTVNVTANPTSILSGGTSTISWTSANATVCSLFNNNEAPTSGSFNTGILTNNRSYVISCRSSNGESSDSATITTIGGTCPAGYTGIYPICINTSGSGGSGGSGGGFGGGTGTGSTFFTPLVLGQIATPPNDAIVRYHEGIETVLIRQIISNTSLANIFGYQAGTSLQTFANNLAHYFARLFGYVSSTGKEIRVSQPDVAAYQLVFTGGKLTIYEYYKNKIVNIQNLTDMIRAKYDYEYYFRKKSQ